MFLKSFSGLQARASQLLLFILVAAAAAAAAAATAKSLESCPTLCDPMDGSPPGSPGPWESPGKNTGVGCHFLLQCMQVKSESEVAQSCPTLSDPMDCSLPGSSIHGIFQARVLEWGAIEQGFLIFPCYSLELCIQIGISFHFSFAFIFSSFHSYL